MRLLRYTDYVLRTLTYVARVDPAKTTIDDIASTYGISRNHVMKIVYDLGQSGELVTVRGRGGGVYLNRDPADINVGELERRCERNSELVECFSEDNACCLTSACVLRTVFADAKEAFFQVLDTYTLANLVWPRHALDRLLGIQQNGSGPLP